MKAVSTKYSESMKSGIRNRSYVRIYFGNSDITAASDGKWESNGEIEYSEKNTLDYKYNYGATIATLEWNRWTLDGTQDFYDSENPPNEGFISDKISEANGEFETKAILTREFEDLHTLYGLTLMFDEQTEEYPTNITVKVYKNDNTTEEFSIQPTQSTVDIELRISGIVKIEIIFDKMLPYRRPRLKYVFYGIGKEYTNDNVVNTRQSHDIDPLSRRLPKESFEYTILDYEKNFDMENPQGVYEFLNSKSPTSISYGYELDDGTIEWLKSDSYLLDGKPTVNNNQATFKASGLIGTLTGIYYKDTIGRKSFYDMAEAVLQDCNLTLTADGKNPWYIDETLKDMYTVAVLPIAEHNKCLQLIAHACRCKLYTTDDNIIYIKPFGIDIKGTYAGQITDNGHTEYTEYESVNDEGATNAYATLEWNRWTLDGTFDIVGEDEEDSHYGYESSMLTDENGIFENQPIVTKTFNVSRDVPTVAIAFDAITDEHPQAIRVRYYKDSELLDTKYIEDIASNTIFVKSKKAIDCTGFDITFISALPYRRARINRIFYRETDFKLDFSTITEKSQAFSKIDELKAVTVAKTVYLTDTESSTLYEGTTEQTFMHIELSDIAENIQINVDGGTLISSQIYGRAIDLEMSEGEKYIVITGNVVTENTEIYEYPYSNTGEVDAEENPLLTDKDMCDALAEHVAGYLQLRNTYDADYRGNPEIETGDLIGLQTNFYDKLDALVLTDEIDFNGSLHGHLKLKSLGVKTDE